MILVTGAHGFVGSALAASLKQRSAGPVRCAVRRVVESPDPALDYVVGELAAHTDWRAALDGVSAIVHAAARVHVMRDRTADPLAEFRRVNVDGTLALARQAVAAGVKRFVFLSSIKVNGEGTSIDRPFSVTDPPRPPDPYGISKLEAEEGLRALASATGLEVVVLRPPLVYGPGVKANFFSMMKWLRRGVPLPFGAIHNRRSLIGIDNLVDVIVRCLEHPAAAHRTFLVADGEDLSTTELLRRLGVALRSPAHLLPVPERALAFAARSLGGAPLVQRLCGSLWVDTSPTRALLGWSPPVSVDEGLRRTAEAFLRETNR